MTDDEKMLFDKQVNLLVSDALMTAEAHPAETKQVAYATLLLIGALVKLVICGGYTGGPADLCRTVTRMWDATRYVGKTVNAAGGDS